MPNIAELSEVLLSLGLAAGATETEQAIAQAALRKAEGAVKRFLKYDPAQAVHTQFYPNQDFSRQGRVALWEVSDTQAFLRHLTDASSVELQLQHLPVRALDKDDANAIDLRIDYDGRSGTRSGSFAIESKQVEGTDFWPNYDEVDSYGNSLCRDGILRSEGLWPSTPGSVKIIYVGGYTQDELRGQAEDSNGYARIDATPIYDAVVDEAVRRVHKDYSRFKQALGGFIGGPIVQERAGDYSRSIATAALERLVGGGMDLLPETEHKLQEFLNWGVALAS